MRMRYRWLMIAAVAAVIASTGCGKQGGGKSTGAGGGETAIRGMTPVEPGKEPVAEGKTPFETALLRAKWRLESAQTSISRGDEAGVQGAVEGARLALADARKSAPRGTQREIRKTLDAIEGDVDTLASPPAEWGNRKAIEAARDAVEKIAKLLEG